MLRPTHKEHINGPRAIQEWLRHRQAWTNLVVMELTDEEPSEQEIEAENPSRAFIVDAQLPREPAAKLGWTYPEKSGGLRLTKKIDEKRNTPQLQSL